MSRPFLLAFAITLGLFGATAALAWTGPTISPPGGNAAAPLNTGATGQIKAGGLQLNTGGAATGLIVGGASQLNGAVAANEGLTVSNAGGAYAYINLRDDESTGGPKSIHANSNVAGFLNGSGNWMSYWDTSGNQTNVGGINARGTIDVTGASNNWAGIFRPVGPYGLVVTANNSGCYSYLAYSSYGTYTNCNVYASDVYVAAAGTWMSTIANGGATYSTTQSGYAGAVSGYHLGTLSCASGYHIYAIYYDFGGAGWNDAFRATMTIYCQRI